MHIKPFILLVGKRRLTGGSVQFAYQLIISEIPNQKLSHLQQIIAESIVAPICKATIDRDFEPQKSIFQIFPQVIASSNAPEGIYIAFSLCQLQFPGRHCDISPV